MASARRKGRITSAFKSRGKSVRISPKRAWAKGRGVGLSSLSVVALALVFFFGRLPQNESPHQASASLESVSEPSAPGVVYDKENTEETNVDETLSPSMFSTTDERIIG
jgi:hypothetical protein